MRVQQRAVVKAFVDAYLNGGWTTNDDIGHYAAQALAVHMEEALLPNVLDDPEAKLWLDASTDVLRDPVVRSAAEALGECLPRIW